MLIICFQLTQTDQIHQILHPNLCLILLLFQYSPMTMLRPQLPVDADDISQLLLIKPK